MRLDRFFSLKGEARVKYLPGEYKVDFVGDNFVICAVTGRSIPLPELRYWSVELQEPYVDAAASLQRHLERRRRG